MNPFEFVGEFGVMNDANGLMFARAMFIVTVDPPGHSSGIIQICRRAYSGNNAARKCEMHRDCRQS